MKKTVLFAIVTLFVAGASSAFAGTNAWTNSALPTGLNGRLSTNVHLYYNVGTGDATYVAGTYHTKGNKSYASSSGDAAIFWNANTNGTMPNAPTGTNTAGFTTGNGWTAL